MSNSIYKKIAKKIDEGPRTAPKANGNLSKSFINYLKLLYTPEEAELVQHLKMGMEFKTAGDVAKAAQKSEKDVKAILDPLLITMSIFGFNGMYVLPPIQSLLNYHHVYAEVTSSPSQCPNCLYVNKEAKTFETNSND